MLGKIKYSSWVLAYEDSVTICVVVVVKWDKLIPFFEV